jgi:hypothetical protein
MKIDLRTGKSLFLVPRYSIYSFSLVTFDVPPQEILTRDSVVCNSEESVKMIFSFSSYRQFL